jgi:hypothetical protein
MGGDILRAIETTYNTSDTVSAMLKVKPWGGS